MKLLRHAPALLLVILLCPVISTASDLFHFRNGFWINLHHYLYAQALATSGSSDASVARDAIQRAACPALNDEQRAAFQPAVDFYATHYAKENWLFDSEMRRLNDAMGDAGDAADLPAGLPPDLAQVLQRAAPAYRESCWPRQQRANAQWIADMQPLLGKYGDRIAQRLSDIYQSPWPHPTVDLVSFANWAGAYTYDEHITVTSEHPDYQAHSGLELLFHESSHAFAPVLFDEFKTAFAANKATMPRDLDHVVIFYTAGLVTKQALAKVDPKYELVGDRLGIFRRIPRWSAAEAVLERYWKPYLEGKSSRDKAVAQVAHAICCETPAR
ncbi:MAG TPA: hypothetical protein VFU76_09440 [Terriglobales bacterium]|nr:hypothetical protein [Terriglobales bacterium]